MVGRENPVTREMQATPPRPNCCASRAATRCCCRSFRCGNNKLYFCSSSSVVPILNSITQCASFVTIINLRTLIGDFHLGGIDVGVEVCLYSQPCLSCCRPDEIDNDLVAHQRTAPPIHGDVREQAMLDLVPFTGSRRIMTGSYI